MCLIVLSNLFCVFASGGSLESSNFSHLRGSRNERRNASCIASASCWVGANAWQYSKRKCPNVEGGELTIAIASKYQHPEEQTNLIGHQPSDTIRSLHTFLNGAEEFDLNQQLTELKTENLEAHRKVLRQNFKKQVTSRSTAHHT